MTVYSKVYSFSLLIIIVTVEPQHTNGLIIKNVVVASATSDGLNSDFMANTSVLTARLKALEMAFNMLKHFNGENISYFLFLYVIIVIGVMITEHAW